MNRLAISFSIRQLGATMKTTLTLVASLLLIVGCTIVAPPPTKTVRLSSARALPPKPQAPPRLPAKRMNYNPNPAASVIKVLEKPANGYGWSHRTHVTNTFSINTNKVSTRAAPHPAAAKFGIRLVPASIGDLAFHGPPYLFTNYAPYPLIYCAADYQLKGGNNYTFDVTENPATGPWYSTGTYFAPADEVYTRSISESVNGYHYPKYFQVVRVIP